VKLWSLKQELRHLINDDVSQNGRYTNARPFVTPLSSPSRDK